MKTGKLMEEEGGRPLELWTKEAESNISRLDLQE